MAKRVVKGDKNLQHKDGDFAGLQWVNARTEPIQIQGLPWLEENNDYGRLPKRIRSELRESLDWVAMQPSGVVLRFKTDSSRARNVLNLIP